MMTKDVIGHCDWIEERILCCEMMVRYFTILIPMVMMLLMIWYRWHRWWYDAAADDADDADDDDTDNDDNDNQKLHAAYNKLLKCVF